MPHTWIQKPDVVMPPKVRGVYLIGPAIQQLRQYWYSRLDVEFTIKGSLRCEGGQIRTVSSQVRADVMVPQHISQMVFGGVLRGWWLKTTWWLTRGAATVSPVLRRADQVEQLIKIYLDSTDDICRNKFDAKKYERVKLDSPIWLDERFRPMIILPSDRARLHPGTKRRIA